MKDEIFSAFIFHPLFQQLQHLLRVIGWQFTDIVLANIGRSAIVQRGVEFSVVSQFYNGSVLPRWTEKDDFMGDKLPAQGGEHCLRVFGIRLTNNNDFIRRPQAKVYGAEQLRESGGVLAHVSGKGAAQFGGALLVEAVGSNAPQTQ